MKKKVLSVILAAVMCLSALSAMAVPASAASDPIVNVSLKGTNVNNVTPGVMSYLNSTRQEYGLDNVTADKEMTAIAQKRAQELMIFHSQALPTDGPENSYYPDDGAIYDYVLFNANYSVTAYDLLEAIENYFGDYIYSGIINSIGIGIFKYDASHYTIYIFVSDKRSTNPLTDFSNKNVTATIKTKFSKLRPYITMTPVSKLRYKITVTARLNSCLGKLNLTNQFKLTSSKPSVLKVKNNIGYIKANGSFTVTAKYKTNSSAQVKLSSKINALNKVKVKGLKVKSPKKKEIKATWKYSISDANGYQIQYSTNSKFKKGNKTVTVKGKKTLKKTIKKLKSKKTYYVRIRAYIDQGSGEKCYSAWSGKVKVKTK